MQASFDSSRGAALAHRLGAMQTCPGRARSRAAAEGVAGTDPAIRYSMYGAGAIQIPEYNGFVSKSSISTKVSGRAGKEGELCKL